MSLDTLLIIIFLVVLPLIEMLRAAAQKRKEQERPEPPRNPRVPQGQPPRPSAAQAPQPTVRLDEPPVDVPVAPAVVAARETMSDRIAARRRATRLQPVADSLRNPAAGSEASTIHGIVRGLRSRGGVHRAIVAMTILGPCRAIEPHAWNERDIR
jgi:hypothetical protein